MVASLGFEPKQAAPEAAVLPLHHEAISDFSQNRRFIIPKTALSKQLRFQHFLSPDPQRHQHVQERNTAFQQRGTVSVVHLDENLVIRNVLQRIHNILGIEDDRYFFARIFDRHGVASLAYIRGVR